MEVSRCYWTIEFLDVPADALPGLQGRFAAALKDAAASVDMHRMRAVIEQLVRRHLSEMEEEPHESILHNMSVQFLYGARTTAASEASEFEAFVTQHVARLRALPQRDEDAPSWRDAIMALLGEPAQAILAQPCPALADTLAAAEAARLANRRAELQKAGLREQAEALKRAISANEESAGRAAEAARFISPVRVGAVTLVPVTVVRSSAATNVVRFIEPLRSSSVQEDGGGCARTDREQLAAQLAKQGFLVQPGGISDGAGELQANVKRDDCSDGPPKASTRDVPITLQLVSVKSAFAELSLLIDTTGLTFEQRQYLPLLQTVLWELPQTNRRAAAGEDAVELSHEEVVAGLQRDTVDYSASIGFEGGVPPGDGVTGQAFVISLKVERAKFALGMKRLRLALTATDFSPTRVAVGIRKLLGRVPRMRRDGDQLVYTCLRAAETRGVHGSNANACVFPKQYKFLTELSRRLRGSADQVIADLEGVRSALIRSKRILVQIAADLAEEGDLHAPWRSFAATLERSVKLMQPSPAPSPRRGAEAQASPEQTLGRQWMLPFEHELPRSVSTATTHTVVGVSSLESSHLRCSATGITHYTGSALIPALVAAQWLHQDGGPLFECIRGLGLAYGVELWVSVSHGRAYLRITDSSNAARAYSEAKRIVMAAGSAALPLTESDLAAAKSAAIFECVSDESTVPVAASQALVNYVCRAPVDDCARRVAGIDACTAAQVVDAVTSLFQPLFAPEASLVVAVPRAAVDTTVTSFADAGISLAVRDVDSLCDC